MQTNIQELARRWIEEHQDEKRSFTQETETATDLVLHLPYESIPAAWDFINEVLTLTNSEEILGLLSAGILESVLAEDHANAGAKLRQLIKHHPVVRKMLHGVWQGEMPEHVWKDVLTLRE